MALADGTGPSRSWMPVEDFRAFQATRPDGAGWELIDGAPVMVTSTSIPHARIGGNVERLLSDAFDPSRIAVHEGRFQHGRRLGPVCRHALDRREDAHLPGARLP